MIDKLSLEKIKKHIENPLPVYFYECTGSTNAVAADLADNGAPHGTSVFARHQTAGRGRLGRSFVSPDDSGIYMSIVLKPDDFNPVLITTAAAVAVCRAIEKICGCNPQIKWVNDIYLEGKKVCGILAEAVTDHKTGQITHIILGIGINCRNDAIPPELKNIAGAVEGNYSINHLAAEVLNQVISLVSDPQADRFINEYKTRSMVIGKTVTVHKGGLIPGKPGVPARVLDIDNTGGLVVIYTSGQRETLSTGEISIRLQSGE